MSYGFFVLKNERRNKYYEKDYEAIACSYSCLCNRGYNATCHACHAADSVYTTTEGKAGTIVRVDNGGIEIKSFEESIMIADGQTAYCIDINTDFKSGYKNRINAEDRMSDEQITDVALSLEYVKEYAKKHTSLSNTQVYLLEQCVVWRRLSVHLGWGYNNVRAAYDEVSEKIQSEVYANAKEFVNKKQRQI